MVTESTKNIFNEYMDIVKNAIISKMTDNNQEFELPQDIEELFEVDGIFGELHTEYQQRHYYIEEFNLVVSIYK